MFSQQILCVNLFFKSAILRRSPQIDALFVFFLLSSSPPPTLISQSGRLIRPGLGEKGGGDFQINGREPVSTPTTKKSLNFQFDCSRAIRTITGQGNKLGEGGIFAMGQQRNERDFNDACSLPLASGRNRGHCRLLCAFFGVPPPNIGSKTGLLPYTCWLS